MRSQFDVDQVLSNDSNCIADGMVFVLHGQTGELFLLDTDPRQFRVLARAKVLEAPRGKSWAPMSLSNGRLFVRDQTTLKCLVVAAGTGTAAAGGAP